MKGLIVNDFLKGKVSGVFISLFMYDFTNVEKWLAAADFLETVLTFILQSPDIYVHDYDKIVNNSRNYD